MERYNEGRALLENEYLLKIRPKGNYDLYDTGFLTKLNQNGSIPVLFKKWNHFDYTNRQLSDLDIFIVSETYKSGWKIVGSRFGESQNWAILLHPDNYTVEIYMNDFINFIKDITIINGELIGEFKWEHKRLLKK